MIFLKLLAGLRSRFWWLAVYTEIVVVQDRVEEQRETSVRLVAPHRVVCEHHDVAFADRYVDHGGFACEFRTSCEHAADEKFLFRSKLQHDTRANSERRKVGP